MNAISILKIDLFIMGYKNFILFYDKLRYKFKKTPGT